MIINVTDLNKREVVAELIDAEEFLENNDFDEELENALSNLDCLDFGEAIVAFDSFGNEYLIEKIEYSIYDL